MSSIKFHEKSLKEVTRWIQANEDINTETSLSSASDSSTTIPVIDHLPAKTPYATDLKRNPCHFQKCLISRLATTKMLSHAVDGGDIEVMGMLVGYTSNDMIVVKDCYSLPVQGTETRVNAHMESYEYMVQYLDAFVTKEDKIVGWYHSHPGYGCWLSNIDIQTQSLNQNYQDPYLAIVVDPKKSLSGNTLDIGAFRTLPSKDNNDHVDYYPLNIQLYQNSLDVNISKLKLKFKVDPAIRNNPNEPELMKELHECVENWFHAKKVMKSTVGFNAIGSTVVNEAEIGNEDFTHERSNSISSTSSLTTRHTTDVEMDDQESAESSLDIPANVIPGMQFQEAEIKHEYELKKKKLLLLKVMQYQKLRTYKQLFNASE
ncbi:Rri1 [Kluyveromyces lactis]|nr:Rri1 [Kluyveromyces lactis]